MRRFILYCLKLLTLLVVLITPLSSDANLAPMTPGPGLIGLACALPWGGTANDNSSTTAYQASSVSCGNSCVSETRVCNDGYLGGSYQYSSCSVASCASCSLPWGGSIAHNANVTAYQNSSVACGASCVSQTRTCNNGSLSGSYTNSDCSVAACADCNGQGFTWGSGSGCAGTISSIASGATGTIYRITGCDTNEGFLNVSCYNGTLSMVNPGVCSVGGNGVDCMCQSGYNSGT